jgi:predicted  nucleic acid-binding Zn-ribbon protein
MQVITKSEIDILVKLQSMEMESNRINSMLGSVSQRLETLDTELMAFERQLTEKKNQLDGLKKKYRSCESDIDMNLSRIKKSQGKLRSVKTNKEYQSILKEIDDVRSLNSKLEDEMIEYLDAMESAESFISAKKVELSELQDHIRSEKMSIEQESEAGEKRLAELKTEWEKISREIAPNLLKTYMTIRDKRGMAIAAVNNAVCQGCHLNLPPQMYNELQRCDSLKFCPNCQRIIYWEES